MYSFHNIVLLVIMLLMNVYVKLLRSEKFLVIDYFFFFFLQLCNMMKLKNNGKPLFATSKKKTI